MNDEEDHFIPPELKLLRDINPPPDRVSSLSEDVSFPFPFNREHEKRGGAKTSQDKVDTIMANHGFEHLLPKTKEPEEVQGSIDVSMTVKCDETSMTVAVAKDSLEVGLIF